MKSALLASCVSAAALLITPPAHAELGDYSAWKTLVNLVSPPPADNKVTAEQGLGTYPMLSSPGGFNAGFKPGSYYSW